MAKRMIETNITEEDIKLEGSLRPQVLDDYIGQSKVKENLKVYIEAAKLRGDALDHVLFYGPPGLGKTTLAGIIANEMGVHLKVTSGPAIEKPGEMAAILNNLEEGDLLFVDEIHRLNRQVEEASGASQIYLGGSHYQSRAFNCPLTGPFRYDSSFGILHHRRAAADYHALRPGVKCGNRNGRSHGNGKTQPGNSPPRQPYFKEGPGFCSGKI